MAMEKETLRTIEVGRRSTLWMDGERGLWRQYHDTDAWHSVMPRFDAQGVPRATSRNVRLDELSAHPRSQVGYRGGGGGHAVAATPVHHDPPFLRRALEALAHDDGDDIRHVARRCGVERSSAWTYAARVVERWPRSHAFVRRLVNPALMSAVGQTTDLSGSLRTLMERVQTHHAALRGNTEWRCCDDRFAHLRLARLCEEAAREEKAALYTNPCADGRNCVQMRESDRRTTLP